jgi:hypothetical protein
MREHPPHLGYPSLFQVDAPKQLGKLVLAEDRRLEGVDGRFRPREGFLVGRNGTIDEVNQQARQEAFASLGEALWRG